MDKGLTRITGGRLKLAVAVMVCVLAIVALPAYAFAANSPTTTVTTQSVKVVFDAGTALKATGASIAINGVKYYTAVSGNTAYAYVGPMTDGTKNVVATAVSTGNVVQNGAWSFDVSVAPTFGSVVPGNGQSFTVAPTAISFAASDNTAITSFSATVNGAAATVTYNTGTKRYDVAAAGVTTGYNAVVATVGDAAGNTKSKTWGFSVFTQAASTQCIGCHSGAQVNLGSTMKASGHNTGDNGVIGGKSRFDGTQGVTLHWTAVQAFTITSVKAQAAISLPYGPGSSFTLGQTGVVMSQWDLPTVSVFWPATDAPNQPAPAAAIKGLTWNSVIGCSDCHTAIVASGPHGSTANFGLDSNFPADYSRGALTKKVTAGENAIGLNKTAGVGYSTSGIGAIPASVTTTITAYANGTSGADAIICSKCHRLMTVVPAGTGPGTSGLAWPSVEGANTAHDSHHQDQADNSSQCVNCHIDVPHGWRGPRLLVDAEEGEGYSPDAFLWEAQAKVREGMNTLSGLNNHPIIGAAGSLPYSTGDGTVPTGTSATNTGHTGTVLWDESQCDACGDHYGQNTNAPANTAVPARIEF